MQTSPFNGDQAGVAPIPAGGTRTCTQYFDVPSRFLGPGTVVRVGIGTSASSWSIS